MLALEKGHSEVVEILMSHGAKTHADVQDKVSSDCTVKCRVWMDGFVKRT